MILAPGMEEEIVQRVVKENLQLLGFYLLTCFPETLRLLQRFFITTNTTLIEDVKVKTHLSFANTISVFAKQASVDKNSAFYDN